MKLQASQITYAYSADRMALCDVSLSLERGQILYMLGHNGSGKSTLLSCIAGVLKPTSGQVTLDGVDVQQYAAAERARKIGLIPQLHVPAFAYSVREMVLMGRAPHLSIFGTPRRIDYEVADHAIESVGLTRARDRIYTELSGGERQLVMIARGLAQQCDFLLMDEPDAHLDPSNQFRVLEIVADLARQGVGFIVASHAPNSALMYADYILLLKKGRTLAWGDVQETLTESLLSEAYGVDTEVIYKSANGQRSARAIVPRRNRVPEGIEVISLKPETLDLPGSRLDQFFADGATRPQVVVVTGESGSGKSAWCADLIMQSQKRGLRVSGVLSPAVVNSGQKTGIDLLDLSRGERRRLASLRDSTSIGITTDRWHFDQDVLEWGNDILAELTDPVDLLIVDELGPLEFRYNKGLMRGFELIDRRAFKLACVTVRPSLLDEALQRWPDAYVLDVDD